MKTVLLDVLDMKVSHPLGLGVRRPCRFNLGGNRNISYSGGY